MNNPYILIKPISYFLLSLFLIFTACSEGSNRNLKGMPYVTVVDSLVLHLDHETPNKFTNIQLLQSNKSTILVNGFFMNNLIKKFDLSTGQILNTQSFFKEGPNQLSGFTSVYYLTNNDLLYMDDIDRLFVLDSNSYIKNKIDFKSYESNALWPFFTGTTHPVISVSDSSVLLSNIYHAEKGGFLFSKVNLLNNSITFHYPVPDFFVEGYFGISEFRNWNFSANVNSTGYVINFANNDTLYLVNEDFSLKAKKIVKSKGRNNFPIKRVFAAANYEEIKKERPSKEEVNYIIKSSLIYQFLLFNSKRNEYYRIVSHPLLEYEISNKDPVLSEIRNYSIIVMDAELNIKGEFLIPYNHYYIENVCYFISDGYLYLQRKFPDENKAIFDKIDFK